jgi:hypothetical protein
MDISPVSSSELWQALIQALIQELSHSIKSTVRVASCMRALRRTEYPAPIRSPS